MVDTVFGGILTATRDVENTNTVWIDGEEVSIANRTSLKNGLKSCFALINYDPTQPDTSNAVGRAWNSFKSDFHRNFIAENRWTYLVTGLGNTLSLTFLSLVIGLVLGFILAIIRCTHDKTGKLRLLNAVAQLYLTVIRGTPVMVQLIVIYFVCLLPIGIEAFPSAVLCFGLNSAAYVAEIVRGGIMAVDEGQTEAGRSLGLNYIQTMTYIIIPQAFKAVLPSLANEFITLLKESSVAFTIGVVELTQGGMKIRSITYSNFMPLLAVALIYLTLVLFLSHLVSLLERRLRQNER
ncbi:MAG: amino acid ABC transporter permease [Clostridia bacterium]|nr:amino acid ABC transporter permease [Clostridia bacterium]